MKLCPVCQRRLDRASLLCRLCSRSLAKVVARDGTQLALIVWAAGRARRFLLEEFAR